MKFVKTILEHENGGTRVTPYGTIVFGREGVCAIEDDELAIKVSECSSSLVLADISPEEQKELLLRLQAEDKENNKQPDLDAIGSFVSSKDNGVAVESTEYESTKSIGTPAEDAINPSSTPEAGSFNPTEESSTPIIGEPAENAGAGLVDTNGQPLKSEVIKAPTAPVASTPEAPKAPEANSDDLITSQLSEFEVPDIKEMLSAAGVDGRKFSRVEDKSKLIEIAVQEKIM